MVNDMNASGFLSLLSGALARSQRLLVLLATLASAVVVAYAQQAQSPFVGNWRGHVQGIGNAEIAVIAVRTDGVVDGKMVFPDQGQSFVLGEKLDIARSINRGVVQGSTLTIETAMGGTYRLNLVGGQLSGDYIRGNTYKVRVSFQRAT
jgi:hypothetical protein